MSAALAEALAARGLDPIEAQLAAWVRDRRNADRVHAVADHAASGGRVEEIAADVLARRPL